MTSPLLPSSLPPGSARGLGALHRRGIARSLLAFSVIVPGVATSARAQFQPGPVYTSSKPDSPTAYPRVRIVLTPMTPQTTTPLPRDLTVIEDGKAGGHAIDVRTFENTGYPLAAVVVVDASGSMSGKPLEVVRDSLYRFVSDARPGDKIGVMTVADDAQWDAPFGADRDTLKQRLSAIQNRGKLTRLYDGLLQAIMAFDASVPARRELTVISDGHDEGSKATLQQVIDLARARGIAINTIGLTRTSPEYLSQLSNMSSATGGSFRQVQTNDELQQLLSHAIADLRSTPVASFDLSYIHPDGKKHRLRVRWKNTDSKGTETTFEAPDHAALPVRYFVTHLPSWAYAVLACVFLALILLVILFFRRSGRVQPEPDMAYRSPEPYRVPSPEPPRPILSPTPPVPVPVINPPDARDEHRPQQRPVTSQADRKSTRIAGIFPADGSVVAQFRAIRGTGTGQTFDIHRDGGWIGAARGSAVYLGDDPTVSTHHAYFVFQAPVLILVDNDSSNGTYVNGELLRGERRPLRAGDEVQVGATLFRVYDASSSS